MPELAAVGPLLGWRLWPHYRAFFRRRQLWLLRSLSSLSYYRPPLEPMRAECYLRERAPHPAEEVPSLHCRCGLRVQKLAAEAGEHRRRIEAAPLTLGDFSLAIVGTVSIWGRVIQHEEGYRAQFGYPNSLCVLHVLDRSRETFPADEVAGALAEACQVPVRTCAIFPREGWRWGAGLESEWEDVLGWSCVDRSQEVKNASWASAAGVGG